MCRRSLRDGDPRRKRKPDEIFSRTDSHWPIRLGGVNLAVPRGCFFFVAFVVAGLFAFVWLVNLASG